MNYTKQMGTVTFVHHEKKYITIEYMVNGKKKKVNAGFEKDNRVNKKSHTYQIGDVVSFEISSAIGGGSFATNLNYKYNNAYDNLLLKAATENKFVGYLKHTPNGYFVKETGSYILFPLLLSPWELQPHESRLNEPIFFKINNPDKPGHTTASLFKHEFLPVYHKAMKHFKDQDAVPAVVAKVSPYAVFLTMFNCQIKAKLKTTVKDQPLDNFIEGKTIEVKITYLSPFKVVVELY